MIFVCFSQSLEHTNLARVFETVLFTRSVPDFAGFLATHMCIWEAGRDEKPELAVRIMKQDFVKIDRSVQ